jgi:hypothetical protein
MVPNEAEQDEDRVNGGRARPKPKLREPEDGRSFEPAPDATEEHLLVGLICKVKHCSVMERNMYTPKSASNGIGTGIGVAVV